MIRKKTLIGAAGAGALAVGTLAAPAVAAPQVVNYSCFSGAITIPITFDPGTLPTGLVAGQKVVQTINSGNVHLDGGTVDLARAQGWDAVSGTATSLNGTPYKLTIAKTTLPTTPATPLDIPATGAFTIRPTRAGTYTVRAGDSSAFIQGWTGSTKATSLTLDCLAPTDGSNIFGTIPVSKDASKTTVNASYSKLKKAAHGTAKVRGKNFGLTGTGKVNFTLKKGTHVVARHKGVKLNKKGIAKTVFKSVTKRGKYTIIAAYGGSAGLKASSGKDTFSVG
jgi:hypothetical protein